MRCCDVTIRNQIEDRMVTKNVNGKRIPLVMLKELKETVSGDIEAILITTDTEKKIALKKEDKDKKWVFVENEEDYIIMAIDAFIIDVKEADTVEDVVVTVCVNFEKQEKLELNAQEVTEFFVMNGYAYIANEEDPQLMKEMVEEMLEDGIEFVDPELGEIDVQLVEFKTPNDIHVKINGMEDTIGLIEVLGLLNGYNEYVDTVGVKGEKELKKKIYVMKRKKEKIKKEVGFVINYIFGYENGMINAHTEGLKENYDHKELQIVLPLAQEVVSGIITGIVKDVISQGLELEGNEEMIGETFNIEVKNVVQDGVEMLRIMFSDEKGLMPDDEGVGDIYKQQKEELVKSLMN